jgi:ribosomal protein S27AE
VKAREAFANIRLKAAVEVTKITGVDLDKSFKYLDNCDHELNAIESALDRLDDLEAKATPKKVAQTWVEQENRCFDCPNCGETWFAANDVVDFKFCPQCGQALDWSEKE